MNKQISFEFIFQLFSLIIAVILVHAIYVSIVRPNASAVLEEQAILIMYPRDQLMSSFEISSKRPALSLPFGLCHSWAIRLCRLLRRDEFYKLT